MSLVQQAIDDVKRITTNGNEFGQVMTFTSLLGVVAVVKGLHTKHHLKVDTDGVMVIAKNASVAVSEKVLVEAGYAVRNAAQEVAMQNHRVAVADDSGVVKQYVIQSVMADELVGLIVCVLGDWE